MSQSDKNFDYKHIWHPYSSMINPIPCYSVMSAKGVYLKLQNGRKIIDGMSSWWSAIHGYNHPILNKSLKKQIKKNVSCHVWWNHTSFCYFTVSKINFINT